jgi:sulfur relay (sulfurtransferase) DsrC/TusE family protein
MTQTLQEKMKESQDAIYGLGYYVHLYERALTIQHVTQEQVRELTLSDWTVVNLAQDFWEALPDSPAIRTRVFFKICEIAEHIFDKFDEKGKLIP